MINDLGEVQRIPIHSREQWLALRAPVLTCSDLPNWCGCGYTSPAELYYRKKGRLAEPQETPPMRRGRWLEPAIAEALADERPQWTVRRSRIFLLSSGLRFGGTLDMLAIDPEFDGLISIQGKVASESSFNNHWISPNGDWLPPLGFQLQTISEGMLLRNAYGKPVRTVLAVLVLDRWNNADLHVIELARQIETENFIVERIRDFWHAFDNDIDPNIDPKLDEDVVKQLYPKDDGNEIDLTGDNALPALVSTLETWRKTKSMAEKEEKAASTEIRAKMGTAEFAKISDGRRLRLSTISRKEYTVKASTFRKLEILYANS